MKRLYHISKTEGLEHLEPRVSTHGKPLVYATSNLELGLLFGAKGHGDLDGVYGVDSDQVPFFYEAYPNAFEDRYKGSTCYIYEVDGANFKGGQTSFSAEEVCDKRARVLSCKKIEDLHSHLLGLAESGKLRLKTYSTDINYQAMIEKHIKDRVVRFGIINDATSNNYRFCEEKFPRYMQDFNGRTITKRQR